MKIIVTVVGLDRARTVDWPEEMPAPALGDHVYLRDNRTLFVRSVTWYPEGDVQDEVPYPYVYVVLGERPVGY